MSLFAVTILGLLGLKKGSAAVPLFIPLLVITILFNFYIRQMHFRVAAFLPTGDGLSEDINRGESFDYSFLQNAYTQPALKAEPRVSPEVEKDTTGEHELEEGGASPKNGQGEEENIVFVDAVAEHSESADKAEHGEN